MGNAIVGRDVPREAGEVIVGPALAVTAATATVLAEPRTGWAGFSPVLAGFGVGVALASAPGPVQACC